MPKTPSLLYTLRVQLEEVYTGVTKELKVTRERYCTDCKGSGGKSGVIKYSCEACQGTGAQAVYTKTPFGLTQQRIKCNACEGEGKCINPTDYCETCNGKKKIDDSKLLLVEVEKGAPDGHKYKFPGEGNEIHGYETGDIHVELFLENKTIFERKGADLATTIDITVIEALTPFEICLTHLDGKKIYIQHNYDLEDTKSYAANMIQPGVIKTVKDAGMPFFTTPFKFGNLYVSFNVIIPKVDENIQKGLIEVS